MAEITYQMVLSTLQTLSIIVGITYYLMILNNQQKNQKLTLETRRASFLTQMSLDIYSTESLSQFYELISWEWETLEEYNTKYRTREAVTLWMRMFLRFDLVGRLLREGIIDPIAAVQLIGSGSISLWKKFEDIIRDERKRMGSDWMADFEYLASEVTKIYDPNYYRFQNN
jgi:hypothetical protein